jgi:DNA invertase Pin-like site-specific DNA recombinase
MTRSAFRCAIYTRVSSDQGLEQDFNSLQAQREAAEAYIKSQAHEGWRLRRDHYDDGGFSGGSMERPALRQLLADVMAGHIDIVVVYKVDRLTRSLADFAKLVEMFDTHKVSFVSVTQSFNTTSSMGRLTLNVLLSFAQFEREVTGERIRDKIAASKKRGIWMGGVVPLGYKVESRKLIVDQAEAETVRFIFRRYLELQSLPALQRELLDQGIKTRRRALTSGRTIGNVAFTNGPLSHILKNRLYLGEINHKGVSYPSEHEPIIGLEQFEAVQAKLKLNLNRTHLRRANSGALLKGRLFDDRGTLMSPSYTMKKRIRYRYYVSSSVAQGRKDEAGTISRLPAEEVEKPVLNAVRGQMSQKLDIGLLSDADLVSCLDVMATVHAKAIEIRWTEPDVSAAHPNDGVPEHLDASNEAEVANIDLLMGVKDFGSERCCIVPYRPQPHKRRREITLPENASGYVQPIRQNEQQNLIRAIANGKAWLQELINGHDVTPAAIARREGKSERSIRMTLSLAFLDPKLIRLAIDSRLPRGFGARRLMDLPMLWSQQWQALGLPQPD